MHLNINRDFIDSLKEQASTFDIISKYVKLKKVGKDWFGRCPFHSEKTGSFKVDPDEGYYHCFGCGAHGDVIKFVMDIEKMSFTEAVQYVANSCGVAIPEENHYETSKDLHKTKLYSAMDFIKNYFANQLKSNNGVEAKEAREYLKERNISEDSINKFQVGFAAEEENLISQLKKSGYSDDIITQTGVFYKNQYKNELSCKFSGRIIFPIIDYRSSCVGFGGRIIKKSDVAKYINSPETEIFIKNQQLYGYNIARRGKSREIIIVEGYIDVISMHQAGFDGAVAPLGTAISENQINMCWKVCDNPIIALDGDNAGLKASFRWIDKILPVLSPGKSFKFAQLPQDSDPDELILNGRSDIISDSIENSIPLSEWLWKGAFLLYPSETPEQKAAIISMIKEKIETIKDSSIRQLYIQHARTKKNELYQFSNSTQKNLIFSKGTKNFANSYKSPDFIENIKPVTSTKEKIEKILVVTIVNHPYILDKVAEDFAKLNFTSLRMEKLREKIMDIYNSYYITGDSEKGNESIRVLKKETADIEAEVEIHAKFAVTKTDNEDLNSDDEDEIVAKWESFCEKYLSDLVIAEDLHQASVSLQSSFSESDWQRLKALKNNALLTSRSRRK